MGINIDLHIYDHAELKAALVRKGAEDGKLLDDILDSCGTVLGGRYVLLNNELWEGNSPYYSLSQLLDSAFPAMIQGYKGSSGVLLHHKRGKGINGVEADDVAERLGFTLTEG